MNHLKDLPNLEKSDRNIFCSVSSLLTNSLKKKLTRINNFLWKLTLSWQKNIQLSFTEEFKAQKPLEELLITYNFNNLCNFSHLKYSLNNNSRLLLFSTFCVVLSSLLARVSKIDRIDGGAGLPPTNQVLGLSSLARVEALGPRGHWGLRWRGGCRRGWLLSGRAVARVASTDGQRKRTECGNSNETNVHNLHHNPH